MSVLVHTPTLLPTQQRGGKLARREDEVATDMGCLPHILGAIQ